MEGSRQGRTTVRPRRRGGKLGVRLLRSGHLGQSVQRWFRVLACASIVAAAASVVSVAASSPVVGFSGPTPRLFGGTFVSSTANAAPDCQAGSHDYSAATAVPMSSQLVCNDDDGDSLTYTLVSPPAHGDVSIDSTGQFTYTSEAQFTGDDSFDFQASDGQAVDVATATVSVAA